MPGAPAGSLSSRLPVNLGGLRSNTRDESDQRWCRCQGPAVVSTPFHREAKTCTQQLTRREGVHLPTDSPWETAAAEIQGSRRKRREKRHSLNIRPSTKCVEWGGALPKTLQRQNFSQGTSHMARSQLPLFPSLPSAPFSHAHTPADLLPLSFLLYSPSPAHALRVHSD